MRIEAPFLLFDDARAGGAAPRLYRAPVAVVVAATLDAVRPALDALAAALAAGRHAAGWMAYEAGYALDPKLAGVARAGDGPLLWFGLFDGYETPDLATLMPDKAGGWRGPPVPRIDPDAYAGAVARVHEHLFAGDFYQANLTFGCDVAVAGGPLHHLAALRDRQKAGWGGVVDTGESWLVSLSPEQFFTIRDGRVEARPMKGTAPRRTDARADRAEAAALAGDPKQRAENLMIVDLMRNDLARLAVPGSVAVPDLFALETYPTLHQLTSRVTARLAPGHGTVDVLRTAFPCGSVTGAPKVAAMTALAALEGEPRGAYTGSMGWIEPDRPDGTPGDAAFNVMIRTLAGRRGEPRARLGLGSGLVVDSVARDEWAECLLKGTFMDVATRPFDLIETMRFEPSEGMCRLEAHLARMKRSAEVLGFRFDRHEARNELQAATFGHDELSLVRLLLSRSGAMAIEIRSLGGDHAPTEPVDVALAPLPVALDDFRLEHKTSDRDFYVEALDKAGTFDAIFHTADGRIVDGTRTSVFVERDGVLLTPPLDLCRMPGVLRQSLIDEGRAREAVLTVDDLRTNPLYVGNSVRLLLRARLVN